MAKYLDFTGLQYYTKKIKTLFVEKEAGKVLSSNDYTNAEKTKLSGISTGAEVNVITGIKRNGLTVSPVSKVVDISVPVKVSDLTNDSQFQTLTQVQSAIASATHLKKEVVSSLPTTGADNVIYLVPSGSGVSGDIHDEYLWINGKFEKIGSTATEIDLSGYMLKTDMVAITNAEIDTIFS